MLRALPPDLAPRPSHPTAARLAARIAERRARVAVIGLGHAGLPLALAFAEAGFPTRGFDTDAARIARLQAGETGLPHLADRRLRAAAHFTATADPGRLAEAEVVVICVPTPLGADRQPDLGALIAASRSLAWALHPGQLVVLESTSWPGTTRQVVQPILAATGLRCGEDFFLGFSPEREDPGNRAWLTAEIPRLVAGADPLSAELTETLFAAVIERVVPVASLEVAEAAKLVENSFRAVNIALANELQGCLGALGLDAFEVIAAAASKPFGFMPFWPGPGVGGHCIPVDPRYLSWRTAEAGAPAPLIDLACAINAAMPERVLARLAERLAPRGGLAGARVLVVGVGYKRNLADLRDSPGLALMELIEAAGGEALYHDPLVPVLPPGPCPQALVGRRSVPLGEALGACAAGLIAADHDGIDYPALAALPVLVDTRNVCARLGIALPGSD
jgi:UDP-N-acetyl-D-glucosamine dehydrogenase